MKIQGGNKMKKTFSPMHTPMCPFCHEELSYLEKLSDYCCDREYYYETFEGVCPECERTFKWDEVYAFSCYDNFEKVDD